MSTKKKYYTLKISEATLLMNSTSSAELPAQADAMLTNVVNRNTVSEVRFLIMRSTNCSRTAGSVDNINRYARGQTFIYLSALNTLQTR